MNGKKKIYLALALFLSVVLVFGIWFIFDNKGNTLNDNDNYNYYIAAFIDGESSTTFPTSADYITEVVCKKNDNTLLSINATASWTGTKWKLSIKDASYANIYCNVNFITKTTWESPGEGTLLAAIKRDNTVGTPLTTPGRAKTADNEAVLASTEDDYGTSYYFRGAVKNNYVEFANKCWRIVRVGGDGSVKLILHNDNTAGVANPCNSANNSGDAAITDKSKFNYAYGDNAFVGLMYGNIGCSDGVSKSQSSCTSAGGTWTASTSYANAHVNINKSTILKYLESWYDDNIARYDSYIADTIWCNDKSVVTDTTFNPYSFTLGTNYGYELNTNYYGTTKRIMDNSRYFFAGSPSLICPNDDLGGKLSKYTVSDTTNGNGALDKKIGLLTADEVVYAGGGNLNYSYYLLKNTENWFWWVLSPIVFDGDRARVWGVYGSSGYLYRGLVNVNYFGVRPSLSLNSTVPIASGKGTRNSPYKVN